MKTALINLANEELEEAGNLAGIGLANEFQILQDRYLLIPYGDADNADGRNRVIQRFTRPAAEALANRFRSFRGKATRHFAGLPFYVGHPDHPAFANRDTDQKAYGWIMDLAAGEQGLLLDVKWTDAGKTIIANGEYKFFSQNWQCVQTGEESGVKVVEPVWLVSCGFTNRPNWPVYPLANEHGGKRIAAKNKEESNMEWLKKLLGLANEATDDEVKTAAQTLKQAADNNAQASAALANEKQAKLEAEQAKTTAETALANEKTAREQAESDLKAERKERCIALVNEAVTAGRVLPADKDTWVAALEADFDAKAVELANAKAEIKTSSATKDLGTRKRGSADKQSEILTLVNETMEKQKIDYHSAYMRVKGERPELFEDADK